MSGSASNNTTALLADDIDGIAGIRDYALGATLVVINVAIVCLNALAVLVITRFRNKSAMDLLVLGLAFTDLVKGLIPVPMSVAVYLTTWYLRQDSFTCDFFGWIAFATNSNSMLILTLMALERYLAIGRPFAYKGLVTPRRVKLAVSIACVFSTMHSAVPLLGVGRMKPFYDGAYCHFDYSRTFSTGTRAYSIFVLCYGFFLVGVVMVSYSIVFYKIRDLIKRHRRMSSRKVSSTASPTDKTRKEGRKDTTSLVSKRVVQAGDVNLKMERMFSYLTVALIALFWFSWLPFLTIVMISQVGIGMPPKNVDLFAIRVAVINAMLNPIACALLCKPYRRGAVFYLKKMLSFAGLPEPNSEIFDPWSPRRRSSSGRGVFPSKKSSYSPSRTYVYSTEGSVSHTDSGLGGGQAENFYTEFPPLRASSPLEMSASVHGRYNQQHSPGRAVPTHALFTVVEANSNYEVQGDTEAATLLTASSSGTMAAAVESDSTEADSDDSGIDREQNEGFLLPPREDGSCGSSSCNEEVSAGRCVTRKMAYCPQEDVPLAMITGRRLASCGAAKAKRSSSWLGRRKSWRKEDMSGRLCPQRSSSFSESQMKHRTPIECKKQSYSDETILCPRPNRRSETGSQDDVMDYCGSIAVVGMTDAGHESRGSNMEMRQPSCACARTTPIKDEASRRDYAQRAKEDVPSHVSTVSDRARSQSQSTPVKIIRPRPYSKRYSMPDVETGLNIIDSLTKELVAFTALTHPLAVVNQERNRDKHSQ